MTKEVLQKDRASLPFAGIIHVWPALGALNLSWQVHWNKWERCPFMVPDRRIALFTDTQE
jgi:hypothetical protein